MWHSRRGQPLMALTIFVGGWLLFRLTAFLLADFGPEETASLERVDVVAEVNESRLTDHRNEIIQVKSAIDQRMRNGPPVIERSTSPRIGPSSAQNRRKSYVSLRKDRSDLPEFAIDDGQYQKVATRTFEPPGWPAKNPAVAPATSVVRRFQGYSYAFVRSGSGSAAAGAVRGNYGGSQAALIARYGLDPNDLERWQLVGRASRALEGRDPLELSAGLSWRPDDSLPVAFHAEYRVRDGAPDGPALFATAGFSQEGLAGAVDVEGYAQAGVTRNAGNIAFFDGSVTGTTMVSNVGKVSLELGGGVWAGGQESDARLDAGPLLRTEVPISDTRLRVDLSWRARVAGHVAPGSGLAVTIGHSF